MKERRTSTRYQAAYAAEACARSGGKIVSLEDISAGGAAFKTTQALKKDEAFCLKVFLKKRMFTIGAIVRYAREITEKTNRIGAIFTDLPGDFREQLETELEDIEQIRKSDKGREREIDFRVASIEYQKRRSF